MDNIRDILGMLNKLSEDVNRLENKVDSLTDSVSKLDNTEKDKEIADRINKLDKTIDMIDENARALTYVYKTKKYPNKDLKGEKNPRYNTLINNDELIKDYKDGMILKELSTKYGLTIPGIRNRLIYLGVYENKYNTKK